MPETIWLRRLGYITRVAVQEDIELAQEVALLPDREIGFALCRPPNGKLSRGPLSVGSATRVTIDVKCPQGAKVIGLMHTHPHGQALPSAQDIASAKASGLRNLCISVPQTGELRCFHIK